MAGIIVLDQNTINKIAAGEVVERPSSVVKELLENAIDAQATAVTVEIRDGGISFIRVTDNGCGIAKEEVPLAFLRHSTSKIKSVEDLFTVSSLGFRGEALSSIAAVAQVELITKTSEQLSGFHYQIEGGKERLGEEIGAPDGTTFLVRNLFYNTPARQKFLKTAQTEGSHVAALVEKIAMSHPDISIRFIQNNQNKLHTSGNQNLKDVIYTVFGREIAANLLPVQWQKETLQIQGFAGKPVIARNNRNFENYYINGRYIKSGLVAKAIEEAYKPFMMQHKYPFVLLHLTIEPEYLDVNVHPSKMELRFCDEEYIFRMIYQAVSDALAQKELIPQITLKKTEKDRKRQNYYEERDRQQTVRDERADETQKPAEEEKKAEIQKLAAGEKKIEIQKLTAGEKKAEIQKLTAGEKKAEIQRLAGEEITAKRKQETQEIENKKPEKREIKTQNEGEEDRYVIPTDSQMVAEEKTLQMNFFGEKLLEPKNRLRHKLIGQLFDTYWLVEFDSQLYIIDQHAAHEKILYEKTIKTLHTREYTSQIINPPIILTLGSEEQVLLEKYKSYFKEIGFEIEPFGGKEYAVRTVPDNLFSIAKKELLMEMIDSLDDDIFKGNPDMIYEKIASLSCKAAVKGNHPLSSAEADYLIDQLLELENPYACPHGRPIIISISKYELERKFKRIV